MHRYPTPPNYKPHMDVHLARNIFEHPDEGAVVVTDHHHPAMEPAHVWSGSYPSSFPTPPGSRGSLLSELYDHEIPEHSVPQDVYLDHRHQQSAEPGFHGGNWSGIPHNANGHHVHHAMRHPHDIAMARRATFPYVRHDRGEPMPYTPSFMGSDHDSVSSFGSRPGTMYSEPLSLDGSPHMSMCEPMHPGMDDGPFAHTVPMNNSPHPPFHDFHHPLDGIKTEDANKVIVPSQTAWSRPPSAGMQPLPCLAQHAGLMVQHTDDAASKETQYLRRRCFNCHTTEPPSWRRSTLNPGKIVCNKCGLYERTHLRPRPLRFDELRAGSKTRKQPKVNGSPKAAKMPPQMIKKEPTEMDNVMPRRASVSSSASSVHSASSDWDESVSVYSGGSNPPSSFNSPSASTFPIPRDPNSQSPPLVPPEGGIRLPNTPLSDIASLQSSGPSPPTPRKAATMPIPYYPSSPAQQAQQLQQTDYFVRRGSLPAPSDMQRRSVDAQSPEVTGWQTVPVSEMAPAKAIKTSPRPSNPVIAA
ncbi:hypothetical protein C8T65DRAFT_704890 [Cerioporus squamosus]|nr:hypothetical protein C8T65DRAFT_704890 [Cerioporus squamosus]